jgi:hypothetical protein
VSLPIAALAVTAEDEADAFLSNLADELQAPKAPKAIRTKSFTQTKKLGELKREEEVGIEPSVSEQMVRRNPRGFSQGTCHGLWVFSIDLSLSK